MNTDRPGCDFNRATGPRAARALKRRRRPPPGPPSARRRRWKFRFSSSRSCRAHERKHLAALNHNPASVQTADDRLMFREFAEEVLSKGSGEVVMGRGYALGH